MIKSKTILTVKKLRLAYTRKRKGYRESQYEILAGAMSVAIDLRSNRDARKGFLRLSGAKSPKAGSKGKSGWITRAVVGFVTSARSENQLKLSSKRARVLDFLYDTHQVLPKNIPEEIRKRGGIEAIARLAAKVTPRRATGDGDGKGKGKGSKSKSSASAESDVVKETDDNQRNTGDELSDDSKSKRANGHAGGDDDRLTIRISRRRRKKLYSLPVETSVKLVGFLTNGNGWSKETVFEVRKVVFPGPKN
jgi:hypothetical protein